MAEDVDWNSRTISYSRVKLKSRGTAIKPVLIWFGTEIEAILKRRPAVGPLTHRTNMWWNGGCFKPIMSGKAQTQND